MTDGQRDHAPGTPEEQPGESHAEDSMETAAGGVNAGWTVLATLISGMLVWGALGWLVDRWLDTEFALPIGLVLGAIGGIVLVVWRYRKYLPPPSEKQK